MARKRKAELDADSSDEDTSFQPKRPRKANVGRKPQQRTKRETKKRDHSDKEYMDDSAVLSSVATQSSPHPIAMHVVSQARPLREALLDWYAGVHASRGMPWRKPYDGSWDAEQKAQRAYEVWVSEIMLQQTQVVTVIPYYNKWMERFPTIRDLASSDIDTVNGLWKGLGYYSRAARLLSGAQKAVKDFGGRLPNNAQDMESKIPGIGRYSAGAICSIAYNQCVPVLDGNVHRLLSRVLALHAPPKAKQTLDILWAGASALVKDADRPGDLNQALIELGSTVCKGTKYATSTSIGTHAVPDIEDLCTLCDPLPAGVSVTTYPMKAEKKKAREELDIVNVIEWRRNATGARWFLLVRRPEGGLLAGLHEFPTWPNAPVTTTSSAQITIADTLLSALLVSPPPTRTSRSDSQSDNHGQGQSSRHHSSKASAERAGSLRMDKIVPGGEVLHIFSHIRKTYRIQWVVLQGGPNETPPPLVRNPEWDGIGTVAKHKLIKGTPASRKSRSSTEGTPDKASPRNPPTGPETQWVLLDAVADANIGTGVLKIWRQVRALWEDNDDEPATLDGDGDGESDN